MTESYRDVLAEASTLSDELARLAIEYQANVRRWIDDGDDDAGARETLENQ